MSLNIAKLKQNLPWLLLNPQWFPKQKNCRKPIESDPSQGCAANFPNNEYWILAQVRCTNMRFDEFLSREMKKKVFLSIQKCSSKFQWHPKILADQLTLSQPGGTDYAHHNITGTPGFSDLSTTLLN